MDIKSRILLFSQLGEQLQKKLSENDEQLNVVILKAGVINQWFTEQNIKTAIRGIIKMLEKNVLEQWVFSYSFKASEPHKVGIIMAGNIPLVGFHDFLCVVLSGNKAMIKLSSEDNVLFPYVLKLLEGINSEINNYVEVVEGRLVDKYDAVIATGSNNSARYFEHYFGKYPNIIRKNRTSVAVIGRDTSEDDLKKLGEDVFTYFGLGCRNVSKLYIPNGYIIDRIFEAFYEYKNVLEHNKYANNYTYQRALLLMDLKEFFDNNFFVLKESTELQSPLGTLYFEYYNDIDEVVQKIKEQDEMIQCVVASEKLLSHPRRVDFGEAQSPDIDDYADGVDTLKFLEKLT